MKRQRWVLALVVLGFGGCQPLLYLKIRNNTNAEVEICNMQLRSNACVPAKPHTQARVLLLADYPAPSWVLRISSGTASKTYDFDHIHFWKLRSSRACVDDCDVPLQLEPDGFIYWVDARANPSAAAPVQPDGFPVRPGA